MLFFSFSANIIKSPPNDTGEFDYIDALLSDLDIVDKWCKVILDDSESSSANCGNGNDEVMKVAEEFTTDAELLITETEEQENLFFNLADEKANATSLNENS